MSCDDGATVPPPSPCDCEPADDACGCCEGLGPQTPLEVYNRPGLSAIGYRIGTQPLFKRTMLDRLSPPQKPGGFDLRLMSWGDGSGVPTSGNNLVIVGIDNNGLLHIRIFDAGGSRVTDTDETMLPGTQAGAISTLKQQLPSLLPPHVLTDAEKAQLISEVTSIVGQTQPGDPPSALLGLAARGDSDLSIALLDAWAVVADVLTFYQERIANESYTRTATESFSLTQLGRLVGYEPRPGVVASTYVAFTLTAPPVVPAAGVPGLPAAPASVVAATGPMARTVSVLDIGVKVQSVPGPGEQPQTFETIEAVDVRAGWNALRPRLSQPHPADVDLDRLTFQGLDTRLKPGDYVLLTAWGASKVKRVLGVAPDTASQTTSVTLEAGNAPPVPSPDPAAAWVSNRSPSSSPLALNDWNVAGLIRGGAVWRQEDLVALAAIQKWSADDLQASVDRVASWQTLKLRVFAFRGRAALFGHNAPLYASLPDSLVKAQRYARYKANGSFDHYEIVPPAYPTNWDNPAAVATTPKVDLDNVYQAVAPESWVVLLKPDGTRTPLRVNSTQELSRAGFGLSAKVTRLSLNTAGAQFPMRGTTALIQSEELTLADLPVDGSLVKGGVVLGGAQLGLKAGQNLILTGPKADAPGVTASERVTVASALLAGGFTVLKFTQELANDYDPSGVTINANVAFATHGETVQEVLGGGYAGQAFQRFTLKQPPLTYVPSTGPSGAESTLQVRVNDVLWHEVPTLYGRGPLDRVYVVRSTDGSTVVEFGDGVTGARLPSGQDNVRAVYRKGVGAAGSVGAGALSTLLTRPQGLKDATNPLPAAGGADPEAPDDARKNIPVTVLTLDRVVSLQDYEDFSRAFSGVAKALATWTWDGARRGVLVTVAGAGGGPLDGAFLTRLRKAILLAGDASVPLRLAAYRPALFKLAAAVRCDPDLLSDKVTAAVESALRSAYSFDARGFGEPVPSSEVVAVIQGVPGVLDLNLSALYLGTDPSPSLGDLISDTPQAGVMLAGAGPVLGAQLLTLDPAPLSDVVVKTAG
jgi:predicted phage baseplate assembly protein